MNKKINFGILGFGLFGEYRLIPGFEKADSAEIISLTKMDGAAARAKAKKYGIPHGFSYNNLSEFLALEEMDAVFIASPNHVHIHDAISCFEAGKHVLLEKPMAMNAEECERIIKSAEKNDCKLMIAHCLRYNKTVNYFKTMIDGGKVGEIVSGTCDFLSEGHKSRRTWKFNKEMAGGGAAFDLGVHVVDTLRYLLDSEVKDAHCVKFPDPIDDTQVDLVATFLLNFANGAVGRCLSSFMGKRNLFLEIFGRKGYIRAYDWNHNFDDIRIEQEIEGDFKRFTIRNDDMYTNEIEDFCAALRGEQEVGVTGTDGLINQKIIDMVNTNQDRIQME